MKEFKNQDPSVHSLSHWLFICIIVEDHRWIKKRDADDVT